VRLTVHLTCPCKVRFILPGTGNTSATSMFHTMEKALASTQNISLTSSACL